MIWNKFKNFIVRNWHWLICIVILIAVSFLTVRQFDSARVFFFGPSEKVTIRVK